MTNYPAERARIVLDCRYIGPRPSGIGELVAALVEHLPELAPDWEFTLLRHPQAPATLSTAANVREVTVRSPANGPVTLLHLPWAVDLSDFDLFHAPANILPGGLTMPTITTVHDIMWLTNPEWCNPGPWGRIERLFFGYGLVRALTRSAAVATVSEATRAAIVENVPQAAANVTVIPSGVAADFAPTQRDPDALAQIGVPNGRQYALVVGQNAPYKNHDGALAAYAAAVAGGATFDLVMVRRRDVRGARLDALARTLGISDRVHVLPTVTRADLVRLYAGAEVLLHPSLCEGFGNPVAEAMACGCPVITSNRSAMPEVAGDAAVLIDPLEVQAMAEALLQVCSDEALRTTLRERGLARAAALSWRECAQRHLALYRLVLARPSAR